MGTTVALMTVEEFRALPDHPGMRMELHDGELFEMTYPKKRHWSVQKRLVTLLEPLLEDRGITGMEFGFRPTPEHNLWAADVVFVSAERYHGTDEDDNLHGAPDLVIEVESPSNTASEFERRETICLRNGCREFWIVYPTMKLVRVSTASGQVRRYEAGDTIELTIVPGVKIAVNDIFASEQ
jgi:Uma2 family endonuclease